MKRFLFLGISLLLINAQGFSAYFGANLAVASPNDEAGISVPTDKEGNFALGVGYDVDLKLLYLHTGLNYTTSSFTGLLKRDASSFELGNYAFKQLEIPALIKMHIFPWVVKPYLFGGVIYQQVLSVNYTNSITNKEEDASDFVKSSFTTIAFGIGMDLDLPVLPIIFTEIRVITSKDYDINSEYGSFNQLEVLAGIHF